MDARQMAFINLSPLQLIQYKGSSVNAWDTSSDHVASAESTVGRMHLLERLSSFIPLMLVKYF